jgi:lipoate---protein ligase
MVLKDISFNTPQENILYDEVLLFLSESGQGGEVLRFWESDILFVVLGLIGKEKEDVNIPLIEQDGISVLRRCSGGGTVLQGKGCLNYSIILSKELHPQILSIKESYRYLLGKVIAALNDLGIESVFQPISDIALRKINKKISGNAQKRLRKSILHHGTILYDFDLSKIERYLRIPRDMPEYRQGRRHEEFLSNVGLSVRDFKTKLMESFQIREQERFPSLLEKKVLNEFLMGKEALIEVK